MRPDKPTISLDLVVAGGTVLTMNDDMTVIEGGVIGIRDGRIALVEPLDGPARTDWVAKETIDATGSLVLPGLINTHTHAAMICFRGLADDLPLMRWLEDHIFPLERRFVNRDMVYTGTLLAIAEMIQSGTTTFCDGYFHAGQVARAAVSAGIRAVPSLGFFDLDNPHGDREKIAAHVQTAVRFLKKWQGASHLVTPALFPHSTYTCHPETLRAVKEVAREASVPFITHLAETEDEISIVREKCGTTPIRLLNDLGILDDRTVAVHCNWPDHEEMALLADKGARVSHNPESGMKLAAGLAPVPSLQARGVVVGLGTDGCASNNDHDLIGEMGTAARVHKLVEKDPTVMDARTVVRMATRDGARVLGLEQVTGSLEKGKAADLIVVNTKKPRLTPLYNPYSQLVYAAAGADVTTTVVAGRILMRDGALTTLPLSEVMAAVENLACRIREETGK